MDLSGRDTFLVSWPPLPSPLKALLVFAELALKSKAFIVRSWVSH